ncbi:MAG: response regulator [Anaerolineales bacterium]
MDEEMCKNGASRQLQDLGFQVLAVDGESECLNFLRNTAPDMVILDLEMRDASGLVVISVLRSDPTKQTVPVIATGADSEIERTAALDAGADKFLPKPVEMDELIRVINERMPQEEGNATY